MSWPLPTPVRPKAGGPEPFPGNPGSVQTLVTSPTPPPGPPLPSWSHFPEWHRKTSILIAVASGTPKSFLFSLHKVLLLSMTALLSRPLVQLWIRSVTYSVSKLRAGPSPPTPRSCEKHSHHEWEDTGQPGITWGHQEEDCIHELSKRLSLCVFMGPSREIPTVGIGSKVMLPRPTESTVKTERLVASVGQAPTGECLAAAWGGPQNEWVCVCVCASDVSIRTSLLFSTFDSMSM